MDSLFASFQCRNVSPDRSPPHHKRDPNFPSYATPQLRLRHCSKLGAQFGNLPFTD
ncbi:unnamed protein product [Rhodiola kirilowii]